MKVNKTRRSAFNPIYWPLWGFFGFLRLFSLLPYRVLCRLGRVLGRILMRVQKRSRHNCLVNYRLCFPEMSDAEQQTLLRQNFEALGISFFESVMAWWAKEARFANMIRDIKGWENMEQAFAAPHGVIILTAHFTGLELAGRILARMKPYVITYRKQKIDILERIMFNTRRRHYAQMIERSNVRALIRALKDNKKVFMAGDVDVGNKGAFVPFFGVTASTITAPAKLARMTGAKILPCFFYRRDDGRGYDALILPMLENFPTDDIIADTARINKILEDGIRPHKEQYLWQYQRFKTRPGDEPNNIYDMPKEK